MHRHLRQHGTGTGEDRDSLSLDLACSLALSLTGERVLVDLHDEWKVRNFSRLILAKVG